MKTGRRRPSPTEVWNALDPDVQHMLADALLSLKTTDACLPETVVIGLMIAAVSTPDRPPYPPGSIVELCPSASIAFRPDAVQHRANGLAAITDLLRTIEA